MRIGRSWPLQVVIAGAASSCLIFFSIGGCSDDPTSTPSTAGAQDSPPRADPQVGTAAPSTPAPTGSKCEELGKIAGTALSAKLFTDRQSLLVPLANRPVTSRLGVIAVGTRTELQNKLAALGTGDNVNYETCSHCFAIALGCVQNDCKPGTWFYPKSGSAIFTAIATTSGEKFEGTFSDVTLEQVTIDWKTATSVPVPGGACMHVTELTFSATATSTSITPTDAGTSAEGGTNTDAGSSNSSTSGGTGTSSGGCFAFNSAEVGSGCTGGKDLK
jgi:hypothetical protein